jgi:hypothetical protein
MNALIVGIDLRNQVCGASYTLKRLMTMSIRTIDFLLYMLSRCGFGKGVNGWHTVLFSILVNGIPSILPFCLLLLGIK